MMPSHATDPPSRSRTYEWGDTDPMIRAVVAGLPGLELLERMTSGRLRQPPALRTLGIEPVSAAPGDVLFYLAPQEFHLNPLGRVHAGILAALLETALGWAAQSRLHAGATYEVTDLSVRFLRAVTEGTGLVTCRGVALSPYLRTARARAHLEDAHGRVLARATSAWRVITL
jgi:uncharacterized protein (TIGR00369 family)